MPPDGISPVPSEGEAASPVGKGGASLSYPLGNAVGAASVGSALVGKIEVKFAM